MREWELGAFWICEFCAAGRAGIALTWGVCGYFYFCSHSWAFGESFTLVLSLVGFVGNFYSSPFTLGCFGAIFTLCALTCWLFPYSLAPRLCGCLSALYAPLFYPCDVSPLVHMEFLGGSFSRLLFSLLLACFYCFGCSGVCAWSGCTSNRSLPPADRKLMPLSEQNALGNECHKLGSQSTAFPRPLKSKCSAIPRIFGCVSSSFFKQILIALVRWLLSIFWLLFC